MSDKNESSKQEQSNENNNEAHFSIEKIYLKMQKFLDE